MSLLAEKRAKRRIFPAFLACSALLLGAVCLRLLPHANFQSQLPQSQQVLAADDSLLRLTLASDQQYRIWTPLTAIAPVMVEAARGDFNQYCGLPTEAFFADSFISAADLAKS